MTPYRFILDPDGEEAYVRIWYAASDPSAVNVACYELERALARDPRSAGKELSEGLWKAPRFPIAFYYSIDDETRTVTVTAVGLMN